MGKKSRRPGMRNRAGTVTIGEGSRRRTVPLSDEVAEAVESDRVWIRVPVSAGRLGAFASGTVARVSPLGARGNGARTAKPVPAPPTADPLAVTADLYFYLSNSDAATPAGGRLLSRTL